MKKLLRWTAASVVGVAIGFAPAVSAASACGIELTGPNSINTCTISENKTLTIVCTNGVTITNNNVQSANSGTSSVTGNTSGGTATSGDAKNLSTTVNTVNQQCGAAIAPATTATTTPPVATAPTTNTPVATAPIAAGQGAGAVQGTATSKANIAALPNTGPSNIATTLGVSAVAAGSLAAAAQFAASVYRRRAFKA